MADLKTLVPPTPTMTPQEYKNFSTPGAPGPNSGMSDKYRVPKGAASSKAGLSALALQGLIGAK